LWRAANAAVSVMPAQAGIHIRHKDGRYDAGNPGVFAPFGDVAILSC